MSEFVKKDESQEIATALRSVGMQLDQIAMEIILAVVDETRGLQDNGKSITIEELLDIKSKVEKGMAPKPMPQIPGAPGMPRIPGRPGQ